MLRNKVFLACATVVSMIAAASAGDVFSDISYRERAEMQIVCQVRYQCDVQLQAGERINDASTVGIHYWRPHIAYQGDTDRPETVIPHLVLSPLRAQLHGNMLLQTTKRTYHINIRSTEYEAPHYYTVVYNSEAAAHDVASTYRDLANRSYATQVALRSRRVLHPENPLSACFDFRYGYGIDRSLPRDHKPHQRVNKSQLPARWTPSHICTDGHHTFVEFPSQKEDTTEAPIFHASTTEGDTLINYAYSYKANVYTIEGVYDQIIMQIGSQQSPLRLLIDHHTNSAMTNDPANVDKIASNTTAAIVPIVSYIKDSHHLSAREIAFQRILKVKDSSLWRAFQQKYGFKELFANLHRDPIDVALSQGLHHE